MVTIMVTGHKQRNTVFFFKLPEEKCYDIFKISKLKLVFPDSNPARAELFETVQGRAFLQVKLRESLGRFGPFNLGRFQDGLILISECFSLLRTQ